MSDNGKIKVETALDCIGVLVENVPPSFQRCWNRLEELARLGAESERWLQIMTDPENQPPQWSAEDAFKQLAEYQANNR